MSEGEGCDHHKTNTHSNLVYVYDLNDGWLEAKLVSQNGLDAKVELEVDGTRQICDVSLKGYPDQVLPLQNVDEQGNLLVLDDMVVSLRCCACLRV